MPPRTRRVLTHPIVVAAFWVCALLAAALGIDRLGTQLTGGLQRWSLWLQEHQWHLAVWRWAVYASTAYAWLKVRSRMLKREDFAIESRARIIRVESAAIAIVVMLEVSLILQSR